jgi:hypothetical protein
MGIPRLIKHSDLVVEYNDGKDSNLFDFREPRVRGGSARSLFPESAEDIPAANTSPWTSGKWYECILVVVFQETAGPEFVWVRPVLR